MVAKLANKTVLKQKNCHFGPNFRLLETSFAMNYISAQLNTTDMLCAVVILIFRLNVYLVFACALC